MTKWPCAVATPLAAIVLCASACSSGGAPHAEATTVKTAPTLTTSSLASRAAPQACNEADLSQPIGDMPTPRKVTRRLVLERNPTSWLNPSGPAPPTVTAKAAWRKLTTGWPGLDNPVMFGGERAQLLLGYFTSPWIGAHGIEPVLAWVIYKPHTAGAAQGEGVPSEPTGHLRGNPTPSTPVAVCAFGTAFSVLNATTGEALIARWARDGNEPT